MAHSILVCISHKVCTFVSQIEFNSDGVSSALEKKSRSSRNLGGLIFQWENIHTCTYTCTCVDVTLYFTGICLDMSILHLDGSFHWRTCRYKIHGCMDTSTGVCKK